jgi:hypothetical protein
VASEKRREENPLSFVARAPLSFFSSFFFFFQLQPVHRALDMHSRPKKSVAIEAMNQTPAVHCKASGKDGWDSPKHVSNPVRQRRALLDTSVLDVLQKFESFGLGLLNQPSEETNLVNSFRVGSSL